MILHAFGQKKNRKNVACVTYALCTVRTFSKKWQRFQLTAQQGQRTPHIATDSDTAICPWGRRSTGDKAENIFD